MREVLIFAGLIALYLAVFFLIDFLTRRAEERRREKVEHRLLFSQSFIPLSSTAIVPPPRPTPTKKAQASSAPLAESLLWSACSALEGEQYAKARADIMKIIAEFKTTK